MNWRTRLSIFCQRPLLKANGTLNEYYHPDTGAALSHKGFMDWNLLVLEMI